MESSDNCLSGLPWGSVVTYTGYIRVLSEGLWRPNTQSKRTTVKVLLDHDKLGYIEIWGRSKVRKTTRFPESLRLSTSSVFRRHLIRSPLSYRVLSSSECFHVVPLIKAPQSKGGHLLLTLFYCWLDHVFHRPNNLHLPTSGIIPFAIFLIKTSRCLCIRKWNYWVFKNCLILLNPEE